MRGSPDSPLRIVFQDAIASRAKILFAYEPQKHLRPRLPNYAKSHCVRGALLGKP